MLDQSRRIILKVGSALLTDEQTGEIRAGWLRAFAADVADLHAQGKIVVIVTSGSVALGRKVLGFTHKPLALEEKQAAAACGQIIVMAAWREALSAHSINVAQILLTADDSTDRRRYLNARNTLETLISQRVIPVINENDTVATSELRIGDNDRLSARVAQMTGADMLVLFSDIDGLYTADPRSHSDAELVREVRAITPGIEAYAGVTSSTVGTGGMVTKLQAAKIALSAGCHMVIARGDIENPLQKLVSGGKHTHFIADETPHNARKRWISGSLNPAGTLVVDDGAAKALVSGKSLLPAGVKQIDGDFGRGDAVLIKGLNGHILGKGLTAYSAEDALRIIGRQSGEIEQILGFKGRAALIHRDDLALE